MLWCIRGWFQPVKAAQQRLAPDNLPLGFSEVMRQPKDLGLGVVLLARLRVKPKRWAAKLNTPVYERDNQV